MNIKKLSKIIVLVMITLSGLFTSCNGFFIDKNNANGTATVSLSFGDIEARTVNPTYSVSNLTDIRIWYRKAGDTVETVPVFGKNYSELTEGKCTVELTAGTYNFYASAKIAEMNFTAAVENVSVTNGNNSIVFSLNNSSNVEPTGTGYINVNFSLADSNVKAVKATLYDYDTNAVKIETTALTINAVNPSARTFAYKVNADSDAAASSISAGCYRLILDLYADTNAAVKLGYYSEIINVSNSLTSSASRVITQCGNVCAVTFDLDGGTWNGSVTVPEVITNLSGVYTLPEKTSVTKECYTFVKWINADDSSQTSITEITADEESVTVKAVWQEIPVASVSLDVTSATLAANETKTLTATVLPENALNRTVTWTSSDEEIATVSDAGVVTAVKAGNVTITAASNNGKTAACSVDVTLAETFSFTLTPESDINVTESNRILTADDGYTNYTWYVDGVKKTGVTTRVLDLGDVLERDGLYNITLVAKKNGAVFSSSMYINYVCTYRIDWKTTSFFDNGQKTVYDKAKSSKSIIVGRKSDYASEVSGLTAVHCGETKSDKVFAYFDNTSDAETLYILSDGKIVFENNDSHTFTNCQSLSSITLDNIDTSNMTDMSNMFSDCQKLTSLDLSNINADNATNMFAMFDHCYLLTNIKFPQNFTCEKVENMDSMFSYCNSLSAIDLSSLNTKNLQNVQHMFFHAWMLTTINFGDHFDTSKVTNMGYMFSMCEKLVNVDLSKFNTSKVTYMSYMFDFCKKLTSIDLSSFDTSSVVESNNAKGMFTNCTITVYYKDSIKNGVPFADCTSNAGFGDATSITWQAK